MKASSVTTSSIEPTLNPAHESEAILQMAQRMAKSMFKLLDRIGTSIALGESGNLEAADAFRRKNSGR
jgi:hypothetical protein